LHAGGPQIQNRAIIGFSIEQVPPGVAFSKFTPPANTGLGFLEIVPDTALIAMSDPYDSNGDGISGVPNWSVIPLFVTPSPGALTRNGKYITRFGKKGSVYSLLQQTVGAYNQDMGITSDYESHDVYTSILSDPEVSLQTVNAVVFYLRTLKAPIQRDQNNPSVIEGRKIFDRTGCESCHSSTLKTGFSSIQPLSFKEIHPYTDLLLHDMGPALDDGYTEGTAKTSEWRTPALWGLGLSKNSQGGRVHGGEAEKSKVTFQQLSPTEKLQLMRFLESL
jgi:CxxC motif-containing protein (DUF1111 family)